MVIKTAPAPSTQKAWEFNLKLEKKTIKTFVYSDTGKDIEARFPNHKITNIKQNTRSLILVDIQKDFVDGSLPVYGAKYTVKKTMNCQIIL